jgi:hypothetical protein
MFTETATQALPILDVINTSAPNNTNLYSAQYINVQGTVKRLFAIIENGGVGAAGFMNVQFQACSNALFTLVNNISSPTMNLSTNTPFSTMEIRTDEITSAFPNTKYVRLNIAAAGNAITQVSAVVLGVDAIQKPGSQFGLNSTYVSNQSISTI